MTYMIGIGKGVALTFAQEGCSKLFLVDRNLSGLEGVRDELRTAFPDVEVEVNECDISDEGQVDKVVETCKESFARLDYALNVAGVVPTRTLHADVDVSTYDRTVRVNEYGVCPPYSLLPQAPPALLPLEELIPISIRHGCATVPRSGK